MLDRSLPLQEIAGIVRCGYKEDNVKFQVTVRAIIDGFVYFSAYCGVFRHHHSTLWLLSFCVETAVLNKLGRIPSGGSYPYICRGLVLWLVHNKVTKPGRTWRTVKCILAVVGALVRSWKVICVGIQAMLLLRGLRLLDCHHGELLRIAWY
ncbi:hypothetical protein VPH35_049130 [Triticum aestivum]